MKQIATFGDARRVIVETIVKLRDNEISVQKGMAIAANMKVLNDNIHAEIKAAKMSLEAERNGKDFGHLLRLGQRPIVSGEQSLIE